jgi:hypothetical protein
MDTALHDPLRDLCLRWRSGDDRRSQFRKRLADDGKPDPGIGIRVRRAARRRHGLAANQQQV